MRGDIGPDELAEMLVIWLEQTRKWQRTMGEDILDERCKPFWDRFEAEEACYFVRLASELESLLIHRERGN